MAKRFTDTGKWDKAWFRKLPPQMKCVWIFLCDRCDHAGIWEVDQDSLNFYIGHDVSLDSILTAFGDKIMRLGADTIFIKGFIDFQYGHLNPANRVHNSIINKMRTICNKKGLASPLKGSMEMDMEMEEELEKEMELEKGGTGGKNDPPPLVEIWNEHCGALPKCKAWSGGRLKKIKTRWAEQTPDAWIETVKRIAASSFCCGGGTTGWRADFDFLLKPDTWQKANDGKYDNVARGAQRTRVTQTYDNLDALEQQWKDKAK